MKKKIVISLAVLLVSGTAFIANRTSAERPVASSDPNVEALKAVKGGYTCYMDSEYRCIKQTSNQGCAACDDDIIVKPEVPTTRPSED